MGGVAAAASLFVSSSNSIQIVRRHCCLSFESFFTQCRYCSRSFLDRSYQGLRQDAGRKLLPLDNYSSPRLVVDWMEELIVGLLLVENAWCQKQSWSFMHLLCSGMVGFGLRRKLGTAGTERHSPPSSSSMAGGILVLSVGFVMFSTVVFLGDLEIYFLVPVSRQ